MAEIASAYAYQTVEMPPFKSWFLRDPSDPSRDMAVKVVPDFSEEQDLLSASFQIRGENFPRVQYSPDTTGMTVEHQFYTLSLEDHQRLMTLVKSKRVLLLQKNIECAQNYVIPVGSVAKSQLRSRFQGAMRHAHIVTVQFMEVAKP